MRSIGVTLALVALGGCSAIQPARMRLPVELSAASARMVYSGIGGSTRGKFAVGAYHGSYERSEQRLAIFDAFVRNYGHSEFEIAGPEISSTIETRCQMREKVLDFGIAEFTTRPMAYRCEFTAEGRAIPSRFELQEVSRGIGGALSREERMGEIALGGETVQIRSVHKLDGSPIEMASPIGYVFEQHGEPVGAVELNGAPVLYLGNTADPGLVRTLTVAATTLAVFWDPANSALDDD
ncbi:hypothetical protein P7228_08985 [Altererythrobacter arenosus]|uniref:Uncharacterized protein n=1 Tax=Altererythrobacter arenosus TaxID=3032592 RepID=A0ABY8FM91_9SPHN|nr:hypothetical protein [Altererythrobacter sp. CAU 1644]WFL76136.1 hypothetical protein P7228_08985 [Altererythrobacter sp. CAU 1644]